jgi:hypothetical protein
LARSTLLEKGKSLLRKDNLLDEEVAKEKDDLEKIYSIIDNNLNEYKKEFDVINKSSDQMIETIQKNLSCLNSQLDSLENEIKLF